MDWSQAPHDEFERWDKTWASSLGRGCQGGKKISPGDLSPEDAVVGGQAALPRL